MKLFFHFFTIIAILGSISLKASDKKEKGIVKIKANKKVVFQLSLLPKWRYKTWKNKTILIPPEEYPHIELWYVPKVKSVKSVVSDITNIIKSDVIKFRIKERKNIKIAGSTAKHLIGTGLEADDEDPSNAEVYIFSMDSKIFVLCVHGEGDGTQKQRESILKILSTIKPIR